MEMSCGEEHMAHSFISESSQMWGTPNMHGVCTRNDLFPERVVQILVMQAETGIW